MKVGDFCKTGAGGTPLKSNRKFYEGGNIPWLLSGEVGNRNITKTKKFITQEGLEASSAKMFPVNTVLIAMYGATAGEVGILRCEASTNQAVCGIYPNDKVLPEYLYYFFLNHKDLLVAQAVGNAQPNISQQKIRNTEISLPPIPEQKRIVSILDTVFADLEQARAKTEQNLKNARELFDSYLQQVFSQKGEGWGSKTLGDITDVSTGGTPLKSTSDFWEGDIPWYSSGELNDIYTLDSKAKITDLGLNGSNAKLFPQGSLLIGMYDTAALKMSILDRDGAFNQAIAGVKPNPEINLEFILHSINVIKPELLKLRRGVRQKNLNQSKIKNIPIKLPSISEQIEIVAEINDLKEKTSSLVDIYNQKIAAIDELKKSILQKAFSGELTNTVE